MYHRYLASYFLTQPHNTQTLEELPWHLMLAGDTDGLLDFLTDCGALLKMLIPLGNPWTQDIMLYWSFCSQYDHKVDIEYLYLMSALGVVPQNDLQVFQQDTEIEESRESPFSESPQSPSIYFYSSSPSPNKDLNQRPFTASPVRHISPDPFEADKNAGIFVTDASRTGNFSPNRARSRPDSPIKSRSSPHSRSRPLSGLRPLSAESKSTPNFQPLTEADENVSEVISLCWYLARFLYELGMIPAYKLALSSLVNTLSKMDGLTIGDHLILCQCHLSLGSLMETENETEKAERRYRQALHALTDADFLDDTLELQDTICYLRGKLLLRHGSLALRQHKPDWSEAEDELTEAAYNIQDIPNCFVLGSALNYELGTLRTRVGDFEEAKYCLESCITDRRKWFGSQHINLADGLVALAQLLSDSRNKNGSDVKRSQALYRQALAITERKLGATDLYVGSILYQLGKLLFQERKIQFKMEAQRFLRRSLDITTTKLGIEHESSQATHKALTRLDVALKLGRFEKNQSRRSETLYNSPFGALRIRDRDLDRMNTRQSNRKMNEPMTVRQMNKEEVLRHNKPGFPLSGKSTTERLLSASLTHQPCLIRRDDSKLWRHFDEDSVLSDYTEQKERSPKNTGSRGKATDELEDVILYSRDSDNLSAYPANTHSPTPLDKSFQETQNRNFPDTTNISVSVSIKEEKENYANSLNNSFKAIDIYRGGSRNSGSSKSDYNKINNYAKVHKPNTYRNRENKNVESSNSRDSPSNKSYSSKEMTVGNARSITGPHSSISSLLNGMTRPRAQSNTVHHRSAWYHVPGRYSTPFQRFPHKRMQKTKNAKEIQAFLHLKSKWAQKQKTEEDYTAFYGEVKPVQSKPESTNSILKSPTMSRSGSATRPVTKSTTPRLLNDLDLVPESVLQLDSSRPLDRPQQTVVKFKEPITAD